MTDTKKTNPNAADWSEWAAQRTKLTGDFSHSCLRMPRTETGDEHDGLTSIGRGFLA
jgi:hypothetical protein